MHIVHCGTSKPANRRPHLRGTRGTWWVSVCRPTYEHSWPALAMPLQRCPFLPPQTPLPAFLHSPFLLSTWNPLDFLFTLCFMITIECRHFSMNLYQQECISSCLPNFLRNGQEFIVFYKCQLMLFIMPACSFGISATDSADRLSLVTNLTSTLLRYLFNSSWARRGGVPYPLEKGQAGLPGVTDKRIQGRLTVKG